MNSRYYNHNKSTKISCLYHATDSGMLAYRWVFMSQNNNIEKKDEIKPGPMSDPWKRVWSAELGTRAHIITWGPLPGARGGGLLVNGMLLKESVRSLQKLRDGAFICTTGPLICVGGQLTVRVHGGSF